MYTDKECPAGHYCLQGTTISTNFPCPGGTYYAGTGATDEAFCLDCPEGHYCIEVIFAKNIFTCTCACTCTMIVHHSGHESSMNSLCNHREPSIRSRVSLASGAQEVSRTLTRTPAPSEHSATRLATLTSTSVTSARPATTVRGELKLSLARRHAPASPARTTPTQGWATNSTADSVPDRTSVLRSRRRHSVIRVMKVRNLFKKKNQIKA